MMTTFRRAPKSSPPPPAKASRSVDRDSSAAPPPKRSRPSVPAVVVPPPQPEEEDDDDIQEVVPVKSEPRDGNSSVITAGGVAGPALAPSGGSSVAGDMYSAPAAAGEQSIAGEEDYGEEGDYEDYSGYGEGYDSAVMDPNMTGGVDGNKEYIESHLVRSAVVPYPWTCVLCTKEFSLKSNARQHFLFNHLENQELQCTVCNKVCKNKILLSRHIKNVHKVELDRWRFMKKV